MAQVYKEKILKDIDEIPVNLLPKFYKIVHLLKTELLTNKKSKGKRYSLKGIWKGADIDENLFKEARQSLFKYQ